MLKHLACIMDGNRRWAKKRSLVPWRGHREGLEAIQRAIDFCLEKDIPYLSLYTFSLENFGRSDQEKNYLFGVLAQEFERTKLDNLINQGVRICFIGDRNYFPKNVVNLCENMERKTAHCDALHLNLLFCYGARQEIVDSVQRIVRDSKEGRLSEEGISEELFNRYLWTNGIPDPDMIIRTGGLARLSNFLLYQAAYSELYFLDCLWPEITKEHLEKALENFNNRQRNFGK